MLNGRSVPESQTKNVFLLGVGPPSMMDSVTWRQTKKYPPNQIVGEEKLANYVLDFLESAI